MENTNFAFWLTFKEAFTSLLSDTSDWISVVSGPWLISLSVLILTGIMGMMLGTGTVGTEEGALVGMDMATIIITLVSMVGGYIANTMLTVRIMRYKIVGEVPQAHLSFEWNIRHWKLIFYSIGLLIAGAMPFVVLYIFGHELLLLLCLLALVFFFARLYFFNAVISVDGANPLKDSWSLTRGVVWLKFLGLGGLIMVCFLIVVYFISSILEVFLSPLVIDTLNSLFFGYVGSVIFLGAVGSCFKQLTTR